MKQWEVVIGIETHVQLLTKSKIFSGSSTAFGAEPNVQANAVDLALPGVLPVLNKGAVDCAIRFGLAVDGQVAPKSVFARKNYFYPDLPKGYQISQYELPVVVGGKVVIQVGQGESAIEKTINLTRAHLEEDAGKSLHEDFHGKSGIDLNRAGTPLLEIVTEPEMRSSAEAVAYARALHALVRWIGICDGNMQEGSFRCDANVSVRPRGQAEFGTRREIKNLNSFRFMQQAIDFEIRWQIEQLEDGHAIQQATVLFDPETGETRAMRSKEDSADYRYFPDPDLPPLVIESAWIEQIKGQMPELPRQMAERFIADYGLPAYDATTLTQSTAFARYFEQATAACGNAKQVANWMLGELSATLNKDGRSIEQSPVDPLDLAALIDRVETGKVSLKAAKQMFAELWSRNEGALQSVVDALSRVDALIESMSLQQMNDTGALEKIIDDVIAANPANVEQYKAGKDKAFNALVGQVMKASKGKANPAQVNALLKQRLG